MSEGNVRNFGALLQTLEDGQFGAEISEEMRRLNLKLSERVEATSAKAKGELTIKIKFAAMPNGTVAVKADFKTKEPPAVRTGTGASVLRTLRHASRG
jgi:hypothetical protein